MKPSARSRAKPKPEADAQTWEFEAIGTRWTIGILQSVTAKKFHELQEAITARIDAFDQAYSRFRSDSAVTEISRRAGTYDLPSDATPLLQFYRQLYDATAGAVTPLVGNLLADAGYDSNYSLQPGELTAPPAWDDVLRVNDSEITTTQPVLLDFGAAGKGYLVDLISGLISEHHIEYFYVDAGGDLRVNTPETLRIGLEHPDDVSQVIGVAELRNQALCGSAGNRRAWAGFHHIMNPFTLQPVQMVKAVWVIADKALIADGLTTALFFVAPEALHAFSFEYLIINEHNQLRQSPGFPAQLFSEE